MKKILLWVALFAVGITTILSQTTDRVGDSAIQLGTIQGTVTRADTAEPISGVGIVVGGKLANASGLPPNLPPLSVSSRPVASVYSDDAGHFKIENVPVGDAIVIAQMQGYFGSMPDGSTMSAVWSLASVQEKKTTEIHFSMLPGGAISGRVFDRDGKILPDWAVTILSPRYINDGSIGLISVGAEEKTDDRGQYRQSRLPPGEYFLSATPTYRPRVSNGITDAPVRTFFPDVTSPTTATRVTLHAGEERTGIDIRARSVPIATISGRVTSTLPSTALPAARGGTRDPAANIVLARHDQNTYLDPATSSTAITASADGRFEIRNVPPGTYDLFARLPAATGWGANNSPDRAANAWAFGRATVEVNGRDIGDVNINVHPGIDVKGRVIVDGIPASSVPIALVQNDYGIRSVDERITAGVYGQVSSFFPMISPDGSFTIPVVPEGSYRILAMLNRERAGGRNLPTAALPASAYVADIRLGAESVFDKGFHVGAEPLNPVELLINTNGGSIEGTVNDKNQNPAPGATVVLVPALQHRENFEMYSFTRTDEHGHFVMGSLAPGQYQLFAWEKVEDSAWGNAEFLKKYEDRGTLVTVLAGARTTTQASLIKD